MDVDADSGSGMGGGAIEARFKALEDANAKLRKKVVGVTSTVQELVTTVQDIGTNLNMGFAQLMQSMQSNQQAQAALLIRIQGSDASIAMIGQRQRACRERPLLCRHRRRRRRQSRDTAALEE